MNCLNIGLLLIVALSSIVVFAALDEDAFTDVCHNFRTTIAPFLGDGIEYRKRGMTCEAYRQIPGRGYCRFTAQLDGSHEIGVILSKDLIDDGSSYIQVLNTNFLQVNEDSKDFHLEKVSLRDWNERFGLPINSSHTHLVNHGGRYFGHIFNTLTLFTLDSGGTSLEFDFTMERRIHINLIDGRMELFLFDIKSAFKPTKALFVVEGGKIMRKNHSVSYIVLPNFLRESEQNHIALIRKSPDRKIWSFAGRESIVQFESTRGKDAPFVSFGDQDFNLKVSISNDLESIHVQQKIGTKKHLLTGVESDMLLHNGLFKRDSDKIHTFQLVRFTTSSFGNSKNRPYYVFGYVEISRNEILIDFEDFRYLISHKTMTISRNGLSGSMTLTHDGKNHAVVKNDHRVSPRLTPRMRNGNLTCIFGSTHCSSLVDGEKSTTMLLAMQTNFLWALMRTK